MLTERQKKMGEERLVQYFREHPEDLRRMLGVINIYPSLDMLEGSPFGDAIAKVTRKFRGECPHGLREIDEKDPSKYLEKHPEVLEVMLRAIQIYTDLDPYVPLIEEILRGSTFGKDVAKATCIYRMGNPNGLRQIIINEEDPSTYKVDPYVALSVAEVGKRLREEEFEEE